jgi:hypothetical protein
MQNYIVRIETAKDVVTDFRIAADSLDDAKKISLLPNKLTHVGEPDWVIRSIELSNAELDAKMDAHYGLVRRSLN